uniref:Plant bHLH transcription factor ACT-like domain-containing protein n=1 Tax=Setaria italica TaxID=4555 RepID=A0A0Q3R3A1_SETIT
TDKISILGSTIQYVKQLEEKVKTLEEQNARRTSSESSTGPSGSAESVGGDSNSSVEVTIHENTVLLKICCESRSGVLVMIISKLESLGLSIINTSVLPFTNTYFSISITAKIGEGFSTTVELVNNLNMALRDFS